MLPNKEKKKQIHYKNNTKYGIQSSKHFTNTMKNSSSKKQKMIADTIFEDKIIKTLGKKLHINKKVGKKMASSIPKSFKDDGLDYLLEICDQSYSKTGQDICNQQNGKKNYDNKRSNTPDILSQSGNDDEKYLASKRKKMLKHHDTKTNKVLKNKTLKEDIYGRLVDQDGNIINEHLESDMEVALDDNLNDVADDSNMVLKQKLKGIFNRLSQSNMHYCMEQLSQLYASNNVKHEQAIIIEMACLIVCVSRRVGMEIGAFFLENITLLFHEKHVKFLSTIQKNKERVIGGNDDDAFDINMENIQETKMAGEKCHLFNLLTLLCHFFNFKLSLSKLPYDIVLRCVESFKTLDLELLIHIFKMCGQGLRKQDPSKMKHCIQSVQTKINQKEITDELTMDSRVQYMLSILLALKNNNFKKIPEFSLDLVQRYSTTLRGLPNSNSESFVPFDPSYLDLVAPQAPGKWFIVGHSTLTDSLQPPKENNHSLINKMRPLGNDMMDHSQNINSNNAHTNDNKNNIFDANDPLTILATRMRINGSDQKSAFAAIMSSRDLNDAYAKAYALCTRGGFVGSSMSRKRNTNMERVVASISLHCCLAEKSYNPFYSMLVIRLCADSRDFRRMCEFAIWDKISTLETLKLRQIHNFSLFSYDLLINNAISLIFLKKFDFLNLASNSRTFLRLLLFQLLTIDHINQPHSVVVKLFSDLCTFPKYRYVYEALRLFVHFLLDGGDESKDDCQLPKMFSEKLNDNQLKSKNSEISKMFSEKHLELMKRRWDDIEAVTERV
ncbi:unnamed protein product [Gordionus sp. m RMFG-2023]